MLNVYLAKTELRLWKHKSCEDKEECETTGWMGVPAMTKVQGISLENMLVSHDEVLNMEEFFKDSYEIIEELPRSGISRAKRVVFKDNCVVFWPKRRNLHMILESSLNELLECALQNKADRVKAFSLLQQVIDSKQEKASDIL